MDDPAHRPHAPLTPPANSGTATIHLQCDTTLEPGYQDYTIDLVADHVDTCTFNLASGQVMLILEDGAHPNDQLGFNIEGYNGPGTYTPASFSVQKSGPGSTLSAENCSNGTVQIVDGNPGHDFPKAMEFIVHCPSLRNSDTHTCTPPLALNLRLDCR